MEVMEHIAYDLRFPMPFIEAVKAMEEAGDLERPVVAEAMVELFLACVPQ